MELNIKNFIKTRDEFSYSIDYKQDIQNINTFFNFVLSDVINIIIDDVNSEEDFQFFIENNKDVILDSKIKIFIKNNRINHLKYNVSLLKEQFNLTKELFFVLKFDKNLKITRDNILSLKKYFFNYKSFSRKVIYLSSLNDEYLKNYEIENFIEINNVFLSIITVVNNFNQYNEFLNYLEKQNFITYKIEIIPIFNYNNIYSNISQPLNYGINLSSGKYILLCHQDIIFYNISWFKKLINVINMLPQDWGVIGMAGITLDEKPVIYLNNGNLYKKFFNAFGFFKEVQTLDELCLIIKNLKFSNKQLYFDENIIDNFHFYGLDICLQSLLNGYKNYAICVECFHLSDGISNIISERNYNLFCNSAIKSYKKWIDKFPKICTTTTVMKKEEKEIFFTIFNSYKKHHPNFPFPDKIIVE